MEPLQTLRAYERLRDVARQARRGLLGSVGIGYSTSSSEFVLRLLSALRSFEPALHLTTYPDHGAPVVEGLIRQEIDIAFARTYEGGHAGRHEALHVEALQEDALFVVSRGQYEDLHVSSLLDAWSYSASGQRFTVISAGDERGRSEVGIVRRPLAVPTSSSPPPGAIWDPCESQPLLDLVVGISRRLTADLTKEHLDV